MNLLSIGGADPSSGAGIQSDIKTFLALGAYGLTAVTAVTAQNTSNFGAVAPVPAGIVSEQIDAVMSDFRIDGVKIGMVYDSEIIGALHRRLEGLQIPIVVDPVIMSTTGGRLLKESAVEDFRKMIVPLATAITPNVAEAGILAGVSIGQGDATPEKAAGIICSMGSDAVVITGITSGDGMSDLVMDGSGSRLIPGRLIPGTNHGSGCNYSAAMLASLAGGDSVAESAMRAKEFATESIKNAMYANGPIPVTVHARDAVRDGLSRAIGRFVRIKDIGKSIPECQTNFVYSRENPSTKEDILGISGRIVRAGGRAILAGHLKYGGSRHVAAALHVAGRKFPHVRSAINLRYRDSAITRARKAGMSVSGYDRRQEPDDVKVSGSSVAWGVERAVTGTKTPPDVVFHTGDYGKEPMIIVFGRDPDDVLEKVRRIIGSPGTHL